MRRQFRSSLALLLTAVTVFTGCNPAKPFYLRETGDLSHYLDKATEVEHPDVEAPHLAEVEQAQAPLTVTNPEFKEIWELTLEETVHIALQNSKVIRNAASIQANFGFASPLVDRTGQLPTVFDAAIIESRSSGRSSYAGRGAVGTIQAGSGLSNAQYGPSGSDRAETVSGVESELAEFDAQFYSAYSYQSFNRPSNQQFTAFPGFSPSLRQNDLGIFEATMMKRTATGNIFRASSKTESEWSNQARFDQANGSGRVASGIFSTVAEFEARFPLLQGRGEQVNRIPIVLARINTDISLADFESSVRNMIMDTENAYWDLYFAYRSLEAAKIGRDSAQVTWKNIYEKRKFGALADQDEAQARGQYFQFRAQVEGSLRDVYNTETRLRWLMGLTATDGRLIRPKDEPTTARVEFDWTSIHAESLFRSPELRQQKCCIKQARASVDLFGPRTCSSWLSVADGRLLGGVGDELITANCTGRSPSSPGRAIRTRSGFDRLRIVDRWQEAFVSVDFQPALGARWNCPAVQPLSSPGPGEAHLEDMELNQSHLMATAIRELDANYTIAADQLRTGWGGHAEAAVPFETCTRWQGHARPGAGAQRKRSQAQVLPFAHRLQQGALGQRALLPGSLLEHGNVFLTDEWPMKAYDDAIEKSACDAGIYMNYGWTRPRVVSRGAIEQHTGTAEREAQFGRTEVGGTDPGPKENEEQMDAAPEGPVTMVEPGGQSPRRRPSARPAPSGGDSNPGSTGGGGSASASSA
ncbi:MAG: TolC family protein [Pirellulales bacterium]